MEILRQELLNNGYYILPNIEAFTRSTILVCEALFGIFIIIQVGVIYFKFQMLKFQTDRLIESLVNMFVLAALLALYIPLMDVTMWLVNLVTSSFALSDATMSEYMGALLGAEPGASTLDTAFSILTSFVSTLGLSSLSTALIVLVRLFVLIMSFCLTNLIYVVGPFAIVMTVFFKDKAELWFTTWLTVLCIPLTVNILDNVLYAVTVGFVMKQGSTLNDSVFQFAFVATGIVMYIMAFWVTSLYAGNKSAGVVLSAAAAYGKQVVGGYLSKAAAAGGGGSAGGGSAPDIINPVQSVAKGANDIINSK